MKINFHDAQFTARVIDPKQNFKATVTPDLNHTSLRVLHQNRSLVRRILRHPVKCIQQTLSATRWQPAEKNHGRRAAGIVPHNNYKFLAVNPRSIRSKSAGENFFPASISAINSSTRARRATCSGSANSRKYAASSIFSAAESWAAWDLSSAMDMSASYAEAKPRQAVTS